MYTEPKLLIFDEATSALDQANENSIQHTIMKLAGELTCVIIAHRLSTVKNCDIVIWVDKGMIINYDNANVVLANYKLSQAHKNN